MLEQISIGICSGIAYAVTGYLKSIKEGEYEKFEPYKFVQSMIVGGVAGAISTYMGWTLEVAQQFVLNCGMVALIEHVKKACWRYITQRLAK